MHGSIRPAAGLFPLLLVGLLAGMTYWLSVATRAPEGSNGKTRHDPDYLVENFEVKRFGPEGNLQHTLRAALMRHYPDDDITEVSAPDLVFNRTPPTFIRAREALINKDGKHVRLIDDVRISRGAAGDRPETVLTTSRLDAWPDDEVARTAVPVTITQGQSHITGNGGMEANNKTSIYILDGPVHGTFYRRTGATPTASAPPAAVAPLAAPPQAPLAKPVPKAKPKAKPHAKSRTQRKAAPKRTSHAHPLTRSS